MILKIDEDKPVDWKSASPSGEVYVEIGFGNGEFLEYLASAYPKAMIVGVEVSQWCALKGARRVINGGYENVRIVHGDARFLLSRAFDFESVSGVFMNYPCPWPKTRHASRRVTASAFAELLDYLLVPGGFFELATDVDWYAEEARANMSAYGAFEVEPVVKNPKRPYVTKYERKWKAMEKDTWLLTVKKNFPARVGSRQREDWPMTAETKSLKNTRELLALLKNKSGSTADGRGRWVLRDTFVSADDIGLVLAIACDEGFEQHFYLKVIPKEKSFTIKVDSVGHPYRTPAMRAALMHILKTAQES